MFFKRKEKIKIIEKTPEDNYLIDLQFKHIQSYGKLKEQVDKIITLNGIISIYPDGADKNKTVEDLNKAKNHLLCIIGEYDDLRRQYTHYFNKTKDKRIYTKGYSDKLMSSQTVIKNAYEDYYRLRYY